MEYIQGKTISVETFNGYNVAIVVIYKRFIIFFLRVLYVICYFIHFSYVCMLSVISFMVVVTEY
jgi:hypothetical protein